MRGFLEETLFFLFLLNLHQKTELLKSTFLVLLYLIPFAFIQVLFSVLYVKVFIPSSSLLFLSALSTIQNDMTNIFHMLLFHPLPREESRLQCCVFVRLLLLVLFFFLNYIHVAVSLLEQGGSKENPLYLEQKEVKVLSYLLNTSHVNLAQDSNIPLLALCFLNLGIFLWAFTRHAKGYCGKAKTKEPVLPLAQNVVRSAVILICVCDLLPAPVRLLYGTNLAHSVASLHK